MLRDPDLIPEPWRKRRKFRPHPLLALPIFPLVGLVVIWDATRIGISLVDDDNGRMSAVVS